MGVGETAKAGDVATQALAQRTGDMACLLLKRGGTEPKAGGVLIGAGDVRTGGDALVEAGGVLEAAMTQGLVALVDAHQQRAGIVVDGQVEVGEDLAGLPGGDDGAGVLGRGAGGLDGPAGGGPGDAKAVLESGIQVGDRLDGGAGRLDVEEVVDAVPAARGIPGRYSSPQMTVLNRERDKAPGRRAMCQARLLRNRSVRSSRAGPAGIPHRPGRERLPRGWPR
ncbi:hypothetical protein F3K43_46745 [Streptomyces sp. LBUM 1476]|nr:hypothetical protein [Streptomyces acidiscabies]MBP5942469.1 hypothetical protein [Streptomyces sp. LBUM 1476]